MTFEQRIDRLTAAIESLVTVLSINAPVISAIPEQKEPEPEKTKEPEEPQAEKVDRQTVHDLCISKVRGKRALKEDITKIIKEFGGDLLEDVPEEKLADLKKRLEAL